MINTITVGAMIAAAILTIRLAYANVHTATYWQGYKEGKFDANNNGNYTQDCHGTPTQISNCVIGYWDWGLSCHYPEARFKARTAT
ncbi:MAG: hypothetical protein WCC17_24925 [Candidatus Nitrosopolaris sp.]